VTRVLVAQQWAMGEDLSGSLICQRLQAPGCCSGRVPRGGHVGRRLPAGGLSVFAKHPGVSALRGLGLQPAWRAMADEVFPGPHLPCCARLGLVFPRRKRSVDLGGGGSVMCCQSCLPGAAAGLLSPNLVA